MGVARTEAELAAAARETGMEAMAETVATAEGCRRIVEETRRRLGPIDVLVNNAGIGSAREPDVWALDPELWHETMAVNLHGPFELSRLAVTDMIERRWGRIVVVCSTAGEHAWPRMAAYVASKHGVLGLTRAIAHDAGRFGVTCNAVMPGWVRTRMAEDAAELAARERGVSVEEVWKEWADEYPAGRVVTAEEVARTVAFLASDEASGINGEAVTVALGIT